MKNKLNLIKCSILSVIFLSFNVYANDINEDCNKWYIGFGGGFSKPLAKEIENEGSLVKFNSHSSKFYNGFIGYRINEDISVEFLFDRKANYPLVPKYNGNLLNEYKTGVSGKSYMINFVYNLKNIYDFNTFFSLGLGVAETGFKTVSVKAPQSQHEIFSILPDKSKSFSWRVGIGADKYITESIKLGVSASMHAIHNVQLKTKELNTEIFRLENKTYKKTVGVGEIAASVKIDLPF